MKTLKSLEKLTCLKDSVKIYVPSTFDVNEEIDNQFYVNSIQAALSNRFGGCTSYNAYGCFVSEKSGLVRESVIIIEAFTEILLNNDIDYVIELCEDIKESMKQESVSLEVNGKLFFI